MFKENRKYIFIFAGVFATVVLAQYLLPSPASWNRSYMKKSREPFGCSAIYDLLDVYAKKISASERTLFNLDLSGGDSTSLLIINDRLEMPRTEVTAIFNLLNKGGKVMIAATQFYGLLADTFHLEAQYNFFRYFSPTDSLKDKPGPKVTLLAKNLSSKTYTYSQMAWASSFSHFDSTRFRVLAYLQDRKAPCLLRAKIGKGELYVSGFPDMFSNYYVVKHPCRELAYNILSMLKNENIIWDEYYKSFNVKHESPLKLILENDSLYAAYLLMLLTIIMYMMMEGRRRQRAIPLLEPVTNTTLEFVNVISHVYFNSRNHRYIAADCIKYFYGEIRKKFNVNTSEIDEILIAEVSELSGVEQKKVKQLFVYCEKLKTASSVTEMDLLELNRQMSNFNKNSLR